ncbi:MAG: hypothetical protein CSA20_05595 [Deltaproteobacteria bacterium]|nr:MAG: hypothetical protein CSA20_05595 [Deltaproteobacteria bacterium]
MPLQCMSALTRPVEEARQLFVTRARICLWYSTILFPLFYFYDIWVGNEHQDLFLLCRLVVALVSLFCLSLLNEKRYQKYSFLLFYISWFVGVFALSLMALLQGAFQSDYYIGILLMMVGGMAFLPITVTQAVFLGFSTYLIYFLTLFYGTDSLESDTLASMCNNSFFFLSFIGICALQSHNEMAGFLERAKTVNRLSDTRQELARFTEGLQKLTNRRLEQLEKKNIQFAELYNAIADILVLIDRNGVIRNVSPQCLTLLGRSPRELEGRPFLDILEEERKEIHSVRFDNLVRQLSSGDFVYGRRIRLLKADGSIVHVEVSGGRVDLDEVFYQFVIRDITPVKIIEQQLLESQRLVGGARQAAIFGLAKLAECRDGDTGAHLQRIRRYTDLLVRYLSTQPAYTDVITEFFVEQMRDTSILHDIGKVAIPDNILLKPGQLESHEHDIIKRHCQYGAAILESAAIDGDDWLSSFFSLARDIAMHHHERWDGQGYPMGLAGQEIPLAARIVALADVYDALTSTRVYKAAYSHDLVKTLISKGREKHFDPGVVDAFLALESLFKESRLQQLLEE